MEGSSVNAHSGTTIIKSAILNVTAPGGTLDLEATSIRGNGADLSGTGAMAVMGDLEGRSA